MTRSLELGGETLKLHESVEAFLNRQLEVLAQQRSIDIPLVGLDDWIRLKPDPLAVNTTGWMRTLHLLQL